ncbi:TonB-dependent siderophore receptor [Roseateles sp. BYS180W]|uniref:TonB-dependent siderophore receptor n=1 Tax=Roseateles rivi TaxID=3299028 RepID=A0ABW7FW56_9BURK
MAKQFTAIQMNRKHRQHTMAQATTLVALSLATLANAQTENSQTSLDRVVVSAKREALYVNRDVNAGALGVQPLHELPFSIGSYGRELMDNQRARTAQDVLKNDPSVQPASFGGAYDGIAVRGFSANAINSVRRDGLLTSVYADIPLENMERVDILKGLSGFLYGVGEPSGLVNYVLKRPTRVIFANVDVELRSHGGRYAHVDAGGSLGSGSPMGYRLNMAGEEQGDFTHAGDMSRAMASAAFDFKLAHGTLLRIDADHQHKKIAAQPVIGPRSDGTLVPANSLDPRALLGQPWGQYRTDASNIGARLEHTLNDAWHLIGQIGYSTTRRDAAFPGLYEVSPNGQVLSGDYYFSPAQKFTALSAQAFANGRLEIGGMRHDVVLGISDSTLKTKDGGWFPNDGLTVGNIYAPVYSARPDFSDPPTKNQSATQQPSIFVSDTISFNSQWRLLLGARYIAYQNESQRAGAAPRDYRVKVTVPSAGLVWLPSPSLTLYTSITEGLEQGAYAPNAAANRGERLDPIRSNQLETGLKWQPARGLAATAAWFTIDKPLQATDPKDKLFKTLGRQRHRGIELALNGEISPSLSAVAGLSWLDATMQDTGDTRQGKRPSNVAKLQANVWLDWRLPSLPGLSINSGLIHIGDRPLDQANAVKVPAYTRWDAGARYTAEVLGVATTWRLQIQNLSDRRYWENVNYGGVLAGASRTVRLSVELQF